MIKKPDGFDELLRTALNMEKKGRAMYKDASGKSNNPIVKRTFAALSDDESIHLEAINLHINNLNKKNKNGLFKSFLSKRSKKNSALSLASYFRSLEGNLEKTSGDVSAYKFAMRFEKNSYEFYKKLKIKYPAKEASSLLVFLMGEEAKHLKILQDSFEYINSPEDWFRREERSIVEGG